MFTAAYQKVFAPAAPISDTARWAWAGIGLGCAAALVIAILLPPDPRGLGTHEQLGMPPCSFVLTSGLPCPTCGMTTAFSNMVRGHVLQAVHAQPAGAVLCLAAVGLLVASIMALTTGKMVVVKWERVGPVRVALGLAFLIIGGWAYKLVTGLLTGTLPVRW
jgi:hypothetical protein